MEEGERDREEGGEPDASAASAGRSSLARIEEKLTRV
jgi:hypothetical protein